MGTRVVALYLRESPMKSFYGMGMDYAWGHNSLEVFEAEVKRAGKTYLGSVFSPIGTKDYSTYVAKIRQSGADGVYTVLAGDDQNAFLAQAQQYRLGDKTQIMTEIVDMQTVRAVGDACIGLIGSSRYAFTYDCPANKVFVAAWQKEFGRVPDVFEGDQYQSCLVLQAGIEKAGSTDTAKLRAGLEGVVIDSIKGKVTMRACDHQGVQQGFMVKVVKSASMGMLVPEVVAAYPADKVTPACNKMTFDN
jgi:branched-chain amino acid transport system substrate-binding protein